MNNALDTWLIFGFLTFFHLWGGAAIGAGLRLGKPLPILGGLLVGVTPFWLGIERGLEMSSWGPLAWQVGCVVVSALALAFGFPRLRAWFGHPGANAIVIGIFLMALGAVLGAVFFRFGSEALSLVVGGTGFLLGAIWFGSGLQRLRGL